MVTGETPYENMKIVLYFLITIYIASADNKDDTLEDGNSIIPNNGSVRNCVENVSTLEQSGLENAAKLLLLNYAENVDEILKENPLDRNIRLMRLLHQILSEKLGYVFQERWTIKQGKIDRFNR